MGTVCISIAISIIPYAGCDELLLLLLLYLLFYYYSPCWCEYLLLLLLLLLILLHSNQLFILSSHIRHTFISYFYTSTMPIPYQHYRPIPLRCMMLLSLLYLLLYYYSSCFFFFPFSLSSSIRIGGSGTVVTVTSALYRVVVVVAVYCRLSEGWLFFHNKGQKNRRSSSIIRYCNIRPSNIKENREKAINLTKEWPLLIHIFIFMCVLLPYEESV